MRDLHLPVHTASRRWGVREWFVATGLAGLSTVVTFIATGAVAFATQNNCYEPASTVQLKTAQVLLAWQFLVTLAPWLVAAWWRRSPRLVAFGAVASAYALWVLVNVLRASTDEWTTLGICF